MTFKEVHQERRLLFLIPSNRKMVKMNLITHDTAHSIYSLHSTLRNLHFTLHFTLETWHCSLHFALHTLNFTLDTLHSTVYTPHSTLYTPHTTLDIPHSTHYTYTPHSTLHTVHCLLYTIHVTVHILHFTLYTLTLHPHNFTLFTLNAPWNPSLALFSGCARTPTSPLRCWRWTFESSPITSHHVGYAVFLSLSSSCNSTSLSYVLSLVPSNIHRLNK